MQRLDVEHLADVREKASVQSELEEDAPIIRAICTVVSGGTVSKAKIIQEAHERSGQSVVRVRKVLNKRTGSIYQLGHRWQQHTEAHNKQVFEILPTPS